ncbi:MAG: endolytic transglycosylase MltG [Saprospirales bacterium]|nr:endolytic transglycosylase MltG [Saprospirales bacterium]MBK6904560.1 endolytic transglycosylase MltG [Saprospirales bacterium]
MHYKKIILGALALVVLLGVFLGSKYYRIYFKPVVPQGLENYFVEIPTGSSGGEVEELLMAQGIISDQEGFRTVAERLKYYRDPMRPGRYEIQPGWNHLQLIRHLRGGRQTPVYVVLTNERLLENVAGKVARFIEPDSATLLNAFKNYQTISPLGYTEETLMALFIPNSYEFFWNTSPEKFLERMQKEHERFWEKDLRKEKAAKLNLTPTEVYTLAAIVEKETNQNSEKRRIAGVYLNRLRIGMRLQADPTCVFATRDFETTRVLNYHKEFDSPYNTYVYAGLPPGPIAMSSIASIDAVLNREEHQYMYFCAAGDGSGMHQFAETLAGHNQNVSRYKKNLRNFQNGR